MRCSVLQQSRECAARLPQSLRKLIPCVFGELLFCNPAQCCCCCCCYCCCCVYSARSANELIARTRRSRPCHVLKAMAKTHFISFNIIYERGASYNIINKHVPKLEGNQKTTASTTASTPGRQSQQKQEQIFRMHDLLTFLY